MPHGRPATTAFSRHHNHQNQYIEQYAGHQWHCLYIGLTWQETAGAGWADVDAGRCCRR